MKIGIDARLWSQTGVGRYVRNLIYNLQDIDKQNDYVLFVMDRDYNEVKFRISNLKFKISNCNIKWHTIDEQLTLPSVLKKENLDLVHFPYFSFPVFYTKPFVITIHDLIPYHFSTGHVSTLPRPIYGLKLAAFKFVIGQASKRAEKIIVPSNETKKEIIYHLKIPEEKIAITYEGIDEKLSDVQYTGIPVVKPYFLYVGNAYPHKNLERLLGAFKNLKGSSLKLVLVGKEDYFYLRLENIVKKMGLSKRVLFKNQIDDNELSNLYRNALAFVTPSLMEGFGLPGLEAMANKCLVLASDTPAHREIYKDGATYFNPQDEEGLRRLMERVYSNTLVYRSRIEIGFKRSKEFSWKKTAEETLKLYESCAGLR